MKINKKIKQLYPRLKRVFFLLGWAVIGIIVETQAQPIDLKEVDSLFRQGKHAESEVLYEKYLSELKNTTAVPLTIYYKLAFINEKKNHYAKALYYLSMIYNRQPQQNILNKINEIAAAHNLEGYEVDDFSFVFLFFRKYSLYFTLFLLVVGIYTFGVLIQKKIKGESIRNRHKWVVVIYLLTLLLLLNLPDNYQIGIVNKEKVYLREAPSAAAPVKEWIAQGNKVTVIGQSDQWLRIWWENQTLYVRKLDVWAVQ